MESGVTVGYISICLDNITVVTCSREIRDAWQQRIQSHRIISSRGNDVKILGSAERLGATWKEVIAANPGESPVILGAKIVLPDVEGDNVIVSMGKVQEGMEETIKPRMTRRQIAVIIGLVTWKHMCTLVPLQHITDILNLLSRVDSEADQERYPDFWDQYIDLDPAELRLLLDSHRDYALNTPRILHCRVMPSWSLCL